MTIENGSNSDLSLPPRERAIPKNVATLLSLSSQAVQESYPGSYVLPMEQIFWLTRNEFKAAYEAIPPADTFTTRNLRAVGAENVSKGPYRDTHTHFHRQHVFPPEIYIVSEEFPIGGNNLNDRTWAEYTLVKIFTEACVFHSKNERTATFTDELKDILRRRLELEHKILPREFPNIDTEVMERLIAGYNDIIDFDENPQIILDGAAIKYISDTPSQTGEKRREILFQAGRDFSWDITRFLSTKPTRSVLYSLVTTYPELIQRVVKQRYRRLLDVEQLAKERTRLFLGSIGLSTHRDIFKAYSESSIPLKFIESKQKRKKLVYPV